MLGVRVVAVTLGVVLASVARAEPPRLAAARRALAELRYADARVDLDAARAAGELARPDLIAVLALSAEVACVLDGAEAGEVAFRRLLVLEPTRPPPARDTPVFRVPHAKARAWVASTGPLRVEHTPPRQVPAERATELVVSVVNDPMAMVDATRLRLRRGEGGADEVRPPEALRPTLPATPTGQTLGYRIDVLDRDGNVLVTLGAGAPTEALPEPAPHVTRVVADLRVPDATGGVVPARALEQPRRSRRPAWIVGTTTGVLLAAAVVLDVLAVREFRALEDGCAPMCTEDDLSTFQLERRAGTGLYGAAAVGAAATLVLVLMD